MGLQYYCDPIFSYSLVESVLYDLKKIIKKKKPQTSVNK